VYTLLFVILAFLGFGNSELGYEIVEAGGKQWVLIEGDYDWGHPAIVYYEDCGPLVIENENIGYFMAPLPVCGCVISGIVLGADAPLKEKKPEVVKDVIKG